MIRPLDFFQLLAVYDTCIPSSVYQRPLVASDLVIHSSRTGPYMATLKLRETATYSRMPGHS